MPLFWVSSVFMVLFVVMMLIYLHFNSINDFSVVEWNENVKLNKLIYMW